MSDALVQLRTEGPDPRVESEAVGQFLLAAAGLDPVAGLITVAPSPDGRRVPWARRADWIILPAGDGLALFARSSVVITPGENLAGEERDDVTAAGQATSRLDLGPDAVRLRGALTRVAMMAGALERISELSLSYARQRRQFGRPIGSFQAVQAHLLTIAQQAALVSVAADAAISREGAFEIAAAKVLAGRAAITAARGAHQVHGAVGVTRAHALGEQTRRLWSWRSEYGDERRWAERLGTAAQDAGADRLYPAISAGSRELEV